MAGPSSPVRAAEEQVSEAHMEEEKARSLGTVVLEFPKLQPYRFPSFRSGSGHPRGLSALCAEQRRRFEDLFDWLPPAPAPADDKGASLSSTKISMVWRWQRCTKAGSSSSSSSTDNTPPTTPGKTAVAAEEKMMDIPHHETFPGLWQHRRRTSSTGSGGHIRSLLDQCPAEAFAGLCREEEAAEEEQDEGDGSRPAGWTCCNCHVTVSDMEWTCWHCRVHRRCKECR